MKKLFIILALISGCSQTTYLTTDERVYRIPSGSTIVKPNGEVVKSPWNGYLISDGRLVELYEAAKREIETEKLLPIE